MRHRKAECVLCLTPDARDQLLDYLDLWHYRTAAVIKSHSVIVNKRGVELDYYLPQFEPAEIVAGDPDPHGLTR